MRISDWSSDVCSSDLNEVRIVAGVLHGADLLCHLGLRDDRLVVIVAATLGEDLVLQMASRDTGALEGAHRMLGIESVAVTGVRVSDHRDIDGKIGRASCRERGCQ